MAALTQALRAYVRRHLRDADAADDLVQDVLAKLVREQATGGGPRRVAAWLFRAARNAIVDRHRRPSRVVAAGDLVDTAPSANDTGEHGDDMERLRASFRTFIHALPGHYREALLLTEYEGLSQRQLADRLGVPLSTAKSRVQRAKAQLAQALHECCTFEVDRRGGVIGYERRPGRDPDCC
jgi:RNA polymerase sigma-70 factor (ECF subfamily)